MCVGFGMVNGTCARIREIWVQNAVTACAGKAKGKTKAALTGELRRTNEETRDIVNLCPTDLRIFPQYTGAVSLSAVTEVGTTWETRNKFLTLTLEDLDRLSGAADLSETMNKGIQLEWLKRILSFTQETRLLTQLLRASRECPFQQIENARFEQEVNRLKIHWIQFEGEETWGTNKNDRKKANLEAIDLGGSEPVVLACCRCGVCRNDCDWAQLTQLSGYSRFMHMDFQGEPEEALKALREAVKKFNRYPVSVIMGTCFYQDGEYPERREVKQGYTQSRPPQRQPRPPQRQSRPPQRGGWGNPRAPRERSEPSRRGGWSSQPNFPQREEVRERDAGTQTANKRKNYVQPSAHTETQGDQGDQGDQGRCNNKHRKGDSEDTPSK
jgi:hypothetical protein